MAEVSHMTTLAQSGTVESMAQRVSNLPRQASARDRQIGCGAGCAVLSDRAIAWLFITPTIVLLLAINIFPLIWTIQLSFTNYRANRPNAPVRNVGTDNYHSILTDPDIWAAMQVDGAFRVLDDPAADPHRLRARLSHRPQVPRTRLLDDGDPDPDDAVAGRRRELLDLSLSAADRPLQLRRLVLHRHCHRPPSR